MGERKVLNKYYDPDFDPALLPKTIKPKNNQVTVRLMLPMSIQCQNCGEYIHKGKKFNGRKEEAIGEAYLGIKVWRFYLKCTTCLSELTFKTDPKRNDYTVEHGASRNFEPCLHPDTRLLLANGESIAAAAVVARVGLPGAVGHVPGTFLIDERGVPTEVLARSSGYDVLAGLPDVSANRVAPFPPHPLRPAKALYTFELVDYDVGGGQSTHPPLTVTAGHRMVLMSHRFGHFVPSGVLQIMRPRAAGPAHCAGMFLKQVKPGAYGTFMAALGLPALPAAPAATLVARQRAALQQHISSRGPVLWEPTAAEYHAWLQYAQIGDAAHVQRLVPIPLGGLPAALHPGATAAPIPAGMFDDGGGSPYTKLETRYGFAMYQPSARGWYPTVALGAQVADPLSAFGPIPAQPANPVAGPVPVQFFHRGPLGAPFLASRLLSLFWPPAVVPGDGVMDVLRGGLVNKVAWLIGMWLADGYSATPIIAQAENSNAAGAGGVHPHETAADAMREITHMVLSRLPADPASGYVHGAWSRALEGAYWAAGERGTAVSSAGFPGGCLPHAAPPIGYAGPRFRQLNSIVPSTNNPVWNFHPGLFGNPDAPACSWFGTLLTSLTSSDGPGLPVVPIMGVGNPKRIPLELLTDTVDVRRHLLAGYVDGDGHYDARMGTYDVCVAAAAGRLVDQVMHLARGLGFGVGARMNVLKMNEFGQTFPALQFTIQGLPQGKSLPPMVDGAGVVVFPAVQRHPMHVPVRMPYKEVNWGATNYARGPGEPLQPDAHALSFSCQRQLQQRGNVPGRSAMVSPASVEWVAITVAGGYMQTAEGVVLHNCKQRNVEEELEKAKKEREEMGDNMKVLENRTEASKREMDLQDAIEEVKELNARAAALTTDQLLDIHSGGAARWEEAQIEEMAARAFAQKKNNNNSNGNSIGNGVGNGAKPAPPMPDSSATFAAAESTHATASSALSSSSAASGVPASLRILKRLPDAVDLTAVDFRPAGGASTLDQLEVPDSPSSSSSTTGAFDFTPAASPTLSTASSSAATFAVPSSSSSSSASATPAAAAAASAAATPSPLAGLVLLKKRKADDGEKEKKKKNKKEKKEAEKKAAAAAATTTTETAPAEGLGGLLGGYGDDSD